MTILKVVILKFEEAHSMATNLKWSPLAQIQEDTNLITCCWRFWVGKPSYVSGVVACLILFKPSAIC